MSDLMVVLVHGAFAESASWSGVISRLQRAGHTPEREPFQFLGQPMLDAAIMKAPCFQALDVTGTDWQRALRPPDADARPHPPRSRAGW